MTTSPSPASVKTYLRKGEAKDVSLLSERILAMAQESEGLQLDPDILDAGIKAVIDNPSHGTYWLLCNEQDTIIASCMNTQEWSDWNNTHYWWLQSVYVPPEWRNQGWFDVLFAAVEQEAKAAGACQLRLYVDENNQRAIRVYERNQMHHENYKVMQKRL